MATNDDKKDPTPAAKKGAKASGTVKVEVLTRIRTGREKGEGGKPGRAIYVEAGEEHDMSIEEAEAAEERGVVKILESAKARKAAKDAE